MLGEAPESRIPIPEVRRDGRAVEGGGLENRSPGNRAGGSNPSPSANTII
jgi:hypothetical protein